MPQLVPAVVPAGRLGRSDQPALAVSAGLFLRPWELDDASFVYQAYQDPAIQHWTRRRADCEIETRGWIARWRQGWRAETDAHWAVARSDDGALVGWVALCSLDLAVGRSDCRYWILPSMRGLGVAPAAVSTLASWALDTVGLHRIEIAHPMSNQAACRVALKSGFPPESTRRSAQLHADGWHDVHVHVCVQESAEQWAQEGPAEQHALGRGQRQMHRRGKDRLRDRIQGRRKPSDSK
ncbi:GNAT family N-acetyltransferase [Streptomyces crystallinus]|uniref:GNAT family N-acetyltransferase n=1 Tax=Streptomyces crystallinus TaxID=68191 RepID=A0ABP3R203_9ACTN